MAAITLAECNGTCWLVGGEQHLDDLLLNTLGPGIDTAIVACASTAEVHALFDRLGGGQMGQPWLVHPGILARVRGASGEGLAVVFAPWSAGIDGAATTAIDAAADAARGRPDAPIVLRHAPTPAGDASLATIATLRCELIGRALAERGVDRARIRVEAMGAEKEAADTDAVADRVAIVLGAPAG